VHLITHTPFQATVTELALGPAEPGGPGDDWQVMLGKVNDVNANGKAVGRSMASPLVFHASHWTSGLLTDLQALVGEYTNETTKDGWIIFMSEANAVNAGGTVVGFVEYTESILVPLLGRFEVTADMAVLNMTGIFPGRALDINASGQVVGYSFQKVAWHSSSINQTSQYAVLWDNFQITSLFGTPSGDRSEAHGINDHGQIVGVAWGAQIQGGWLWQDGQFTLTGNNNPSAINNAGQIVGRFPNGLGFPQAFLWERSVQTALPMLPGHGISDALDINAAGQIVGYSQAGDIRSVTTRRAVVWSEGVVHDLTAMLPRDSGWTLGIATGISDAGHVVGLGTYRGERKGFVLTLPQRLTVTGIFSNMSRMA